MMGQAYNRKLPMGAEVLPGGGVHFRVWAPRCRTVAVVLEEDPSSQSAGETRTVPLTAETQGYFAETVPFARAGMLYRFRLDGADPAYPDPAARFQPQGPHGPSQIIDPGQFAWTDATWRGVPLKGQVIYEMHIGTFTPEGNWTAARRELKELADLGITVVEVMPVADFSGRFGWGYDGVDLFAPTRLYGDPDDFRRFVDQAHAVGLGVILDVVYNHFGPDGNYLKQFAEDYFTDRYENEWGQALNFDGPHSSPVREFFQANAAYWIDEFHLDGLRLDATQQIFDNSKEHILAAITRTVRAAARGRSTLLVAENEVQDVQMVRPLEQGGFGIDAIWNDDFHHAAMVALTGHHEAYYSDYRGAPQEFLSALKWGFLYQGQRYQWQKKRRGTPTLGFPPATFVTFLQNHDQVANSAHGLRCHLLSHPGQYRAMTALYLLGPGTPMVFQGEEFAASSPFYFFADHNEELARLVAQGRGKFLAQFPTVADPAIQACLPDPANPKTFERCKLNLAERHTHVEAYAMYRDLLRLRRTDPAFRSQDGQRMHGAVLSAHAFVLRFMVEDGDDRLMVVNLGTDLHLDPAPEPLLAPPRDQRWQTLWSSEDSRYGGNGMAPLDTEENWRLPGNATVILTPRALA